MDPYGKAIPQPWGMEKIVWEKILPQGGFSSQKELIKYLSAHVRNAFRVEGIEI
jgi:hypothetical protein